MLLDLLKTLANKDRLRIINLIMIRPVCLCEIEIILNISQTNCTKQIKKLIAANIVEVRRVSIWNEYRLQSNIIINNPWLLERMEQERKTDNQFIEDIERYNFYMNGNYEDLFDNSLTSYIRDKFEIDYITSLKNTK